MILGIRPPLEQQPVPIVKHKDGKRPVESSFQVGLQFFLDANCLISIVNEDNLLHNRPPTLTDYYASAPA